VKHIVVLGHARCGGIKAYVEQIEPLSPGDFIGNWMALIKPAVAKLGPQSEVTPEKYLEQLEQASVLQTLGNLMTFPCVRILAERGRIFLHGAYFDVATGQLSVLDEKSGEFRAVERGVPKPA
jgi:carbonic anhydrase